MRDDTDWLSARKGEAVADVLQRFVVRWRRDCWHDRLATAHAAATDYARLTGKRQRVRRVMSAWVIVDAAR